MSYLADYFYEHLIPTLNERLDFCFCTTSTQLPNTQQGRIQNEPIVLAMGQVQYLRSIGLTWTSQHVS
jgi:hypothetical protein